MGEQAVPQPARAAADSGRLRAVPAGSLLVRSWWLVEQLVKGSLAAQHELVHWLRVLPVVFKARGPRPAAGRRWVAPGRGRLGVRRGAAAVERQRLTHPPVEEIGDHRELLAGRLATVTGLGGEWPNARDRHGGVPLSASDGGGLERA